jgi:superfamily II DNA helicase RecQ
MQIKLFTIPVFNGEPMLEEMNRFLRGHRVLDVQQEFATMQQGAFWCFSVRYIFGAAVTPTGAKKEKIDYKNVLDEKTFVVFSRLRACRKEIAREDAIPAFAVFTDAELANMAKLSELTVKEIGSIKGIGSKKLERYGNRILGLYEKKIEQNETSG